MMGKIRPAFTVYRPEKGEYSGGFEQLLRQEKTLYRVSNERTDDPVTCFEGIFPDWAYEYTESGNVAVVTGAGRDTFRFDSGYLARASLEYIDLQDFDQGKARISSLVSIFKGEGKGELTTHENRTIKQNRRPAFHPVFIYRRYGKGLIIYTGVPFMQILTAEGSDLRRTSDVLDFDERICSTDKQKIASALRCIFRDAMHEAGLPYLSLWYYPSGAPDIFAYSIDGDGLLSEGVDALISAARQTDTRLTYYINKELCADDPEVREKLQKIAENDIIASHGGIHNAKDSYEDNIEDLKETEEWLEGLGISCEKSYAAPRGMYCHELGKALKDRGYRHSRDFGFSLDDYPYFPYNDGVCDTPLQLACDGFNVCRLMGLHEEKGLPAPTAEEIIEAYRKEIDLKFSRKLPLLFFCHPQYFGLYAGEVYPVIVEYARSRGAVLTDYLAYGDFWLDRDECIYDAIFEDGQLTITRDKWDERMRICIDDVIQE